MCRTCLANQKKDKSRSKSSFVGAGDEPKRHIVLAGKRKIVGVDDVTDEEEYNKVENMTPFAVEVDTSILLAQEEAPYGRHCWRSLSTHFTI